MNRVLGLIVFVLSANIGFAQVSEKELLKKTEEVVSKIVVEKPNGWVKKGTLTVLVNQATFNNWLAGGQSSISGNAALRYEFNYKSDSWTWDNRATGNYGLTKIKDQPIQKTDDRIEYNSLLGKKISNNWYYSAFFNFKSQLDAGYDPANQSVQITHILSPAYFQLGPGILWKKSDNLKINFAPATSKLILVDPHFTENGQAFGVLQGNSSRYEIGAAVNSYYKFNLMENITMENILNLYSNYLDQPQDIDLDYTINIVMKINKYLTTNLAFQTIYDDNAFAGFQTRQVIGIGVNYGF